MLLARHVFPAGDHPHRTQAHTRRSPWFAAWSQRAQDASPAQRGRRSPTAARAARAGRGSASATARATHLPGVGKAARRVLAVDDAAARRHQDGHGGLRAQRPAARVCPRSRPSCGLALLGRSVRWGRRLRHGHLAVAVDADSEHQDGECNPLREAHLLSVRAHEEFAREAERGGRRDQRHHLQRGAAHVAFNMHSNAVSWSARRRTGSAWLGVRRVPGQ